MDAVERLARLIEEHVGSMSSRELSQRAGGKPSYQTIQNIRKGDAKNVQRGTLDGLARALRLPRAQVYEVAGMQLEPLRLPASADELDETRRARVIAMVLDEVEEQRRELGE